MKKLYIVGAIILIIVISLVVYLGNSSSNEGASAVTNLDTTTNSDTSTEVAPTDSGTYTTLATYENDSQKYKDTKVVYFFHASWCPICQSIDKEILATPTKIPENVTIVKTDFDSATSLRKDFGVTTQYTFVQVDQNNDEVAQWTATTLDKALAGIQ